MKALPHAVLFLAVLCSMLGCKADGDKGGHVDDSVPQFLSLAERPGGGWVAVSVSPFDGSRDTLVIDHPLTNLIVMSTSHVGFLDALDALDCVSGVSGLDFIYTTPDTMNMPSGSDPYSLAVMHSGSDASLREAPPIASHRSAPVPPLVPRVALSSHTVPYGQNHESVVNNSGALSSGLASPDRSHPRLVRGRGPLAKRVGGAERSEESGLSGPDDGSKSSEPPIPSDRLFSPVDVGYDAAPDYEKIVALKPDVVLTYAVSGAKSPFVTKLTQLGIKVFIVNEHLESHPLARASYIRLFGALTGRMPEADSIFNSVKDAYSSIAGSVESAELPRRKVLLNIPYNDQWFVPSTDSYLTSLIRDAGGDVLGCEEGRAASTVMPVEKAYSLSKEADCWLNVGWCTTLSQLLGVNPVFEDMVRNIQDNALKLGYGSYPVIWNDNKRVNAKGGNDIWQSGVARPDLLLKDLVTVLHPDNQGEAAETIYYRQIN